VNDFSIAENLALATGARPRDAQSIIEATGLDLRDVTRRARDLAVGEKSKLELIKAIARKPELLILDEPTSVLTPYESDELFRVMRRIAAEGTAVVFISHKVREVVEVATRVAVMRRGRVVVEYSIRAEGPSQVAGALSGGNQQKVILARELDRAPELIVAAEPTRGLDIEATRFVHDRLRHAANRGAKIVLITSDLDEAFTLADVIQVIDRGKLSERMTPGEASSRVASLMAGVA